MDQQSQTNSPSEHGPAAQDDREHDPAPAAAAARLTRRSLLSGGAAVSPVLLTLASGPVGATATCVVASSFVSVAEFASRNGGSAMPKCTSVTADHWYSHACRRRSGSGGMDSDPLISPIMMAPCSTHLGARGPTTEFRGMKVYQLLRVNASAGPVSGSQTTDRDAIWSGSISQSGMLGVAQHLLTLALSFKNNKFALQPGYFSDQYFKNVWARVTPSGQYNHPDGIVWTADQTISWLRLLQYPPA